MMEQDEAKNLEVRMYFLTNRSDVSVRYYGTIGESIYRIVGFSGWCATPHFGWDHSKMHGHVLDEVSGHGGSAALTPRISRDEALACLRQWGWSPDELDELPEETD